MLVEQIIELESRVSRALVVHIFLKFKNCFCFFFHDKTKISMANLRVNYLMLKMLLKLMYLASPDLGQVTKFNPKMQDFNVFWT